MPERTPDRLVAQGRKAFAEIWAGCAPGMRVWIAGAPGEPTAALDALAAEPALGRGLDFCGIWLPGVNERDPTAGVPGATAETIFVNRGQREGFAAGRIRHVPRHYSALPRWIAAAPPHCVFMQVSPPVNGCVSPGLASDFAQTLAATPARLVGQVNPAMPAPPGAPRLAVARFSALVTADTPLLTHDPGPADAATLAIAGQVAGLIDCGDTVSVGIGKAANAVLAALIDHRDLAYHAGMVTDGLLPLLDRTVLTRGVTAGVALGSQDLYRRLTDEPRIRFRGVAHTHSAAVLAAIPNLVTVNAAVEIDLMGQANSEMVGGRQISGHGGAADFHRGALAAPGGRAILALPSTAGRSRTSRIRVALEAGTPVSLPRADAGIVVTEYGIADLAGLDSDARAQALIAIADPAHRDALANGWDARRRAM